MKQAFLAVADDQNRQPTAQPTKGQANLFGCLVATGIGSVLGGMLVAQLGTSGITFNATPSLGAILISFGVSVGIGVLFGYLPANKAAKLNPIDALRYE